MYSRVWLVKLEWSGRMHLKVLNCVMVVMCQTLDTPFDSDLYFVSLVVLIVDTFFLQLEISTNSINEGSLSEASTLRLGDRRCSTWTRTLHFICGLDAARFYENRNWITAFTEVRHLTPYWTLSSIQRFRVSVRSAVFLCKEFPPVDLS
jgi:hypothetical protein